MSQLRKNVKGVRELSSNNALFLQLCDQRRWLRSTAPEMYEKSVAEFEKLRELKAWFDTLDRDGSGEIDIDELEDPLTSLGIAFSRQEVEELVATVDEDGSGEIGL